MTNLFAFGHFFGFTSTINFATTIFKEISDILYSLLLQFEVVKLSKQRVLYEQSKPLYLELVDKQISEASTKIKESKLKVSKSDAETHFLKAENAELEAMHFINEIKTSPVYKLNYERKFKPLFPLAGIYSVAFLLFSAFAEANHNDHVICFNTILFINISMVFLFLSNHFGWIWLKFKSPDTRAVLLCVILICLTFLSWLLAYLVHKNPSLALFKIDGHNTILFICTFLLSCLPFLALAIKFVHVNFIAYKKNRKFRKANLIIAKLLGGLSDKKGTELAIS